MRPTKGRAREGADVRFDPLLGLLIYARIAVHGAKSASKTIVPKQADCAERVRPQSVTSKSGRQGKWCALVAQLALLRLRLMYAMQAAQVARGQPVGSALYLRRCAVRPQATSKSSSKER
jgi:hypothetical protein